MWFACREAGIARCALLGACGKASMWQDFKDSGLHVPLQKQGPSNFEGPQAAKVEAGTGPLLLLAAAQSLTAFESPGAW
jgi:hypothetical protein